MSPETKMFKWWRQRKSDNVVDREERKMKKKKKIYKKGRTGGVDMEGKTCPNLHFE